MVRTATEGIEGGRQTVLTELCGGNLKKIDGKMISDGIARGDESRNGSCTRPPSGSALASPVSLTS